MAGKLSEPKIITDLDQKVVCLLPTGFYFDDERWDKIWQQYEINGDTLSMDDLKVLFPDEATVQNPAEDNGETFSKCK